MTAPPPLRGLYAITPEDRLLPRLSALVSMVLAGGVGLVQYRNKSAPPPLRRAQAAELLRICHGAGARLIINDDLWLAVELGADGAHVSLEDCPGGSLQAARDILGPHRLLGISCHASLEEGAQAAPFADYLAFGSMFASSTKPQAQGCPLSLLTEAKKQFGLPVAAIGGITVENAPKLIAAGADMVAVVNGLFDAMNIQKRAEKFGALFS